MFFVNVSLFVIFYYYLLLWTLALFIIGNYDYIILNTEYTEYTEYTDILVWHMVGYGRVGVGWYYAYLAERRFRVLEINVP